MATMTEGQKRQRMIDRATGKSAEQAAAGVRPVLVRQFDNEDGASHSAWSVMSRTMGGAHYLVDAIVDGDGVHTLCDCQAADICWHRAHVRAAILGEIDFIDRRRAQVTRPALTADDLSGPRW